MTQETYDADIATLESARDEAIAQRDARPSFEFFSTSVETARLAGRNDVTQNPGNYDLVSEEDYDSVVDERDSRPTATELATLREQLTTAQEERDARFTEDQIRGLSADYTIGLNEAGNVQMKFNLFESADLNNFSSFMVDPDSVSVVDGSICLEFTPADRAAFFRFNVE